jgi:hypothetical protein
MKTPIKITLQKLSSTLAPEAEYRISRLCRAITVDADKRTNLKVGDTVTSKEAEQLCRCRAYEVTVVAA